MSRRFFWLIPIALCWVASLLLPAVTVGTGPTVDGWTLLRRGWQAADSGIYAWYANPLFLLAWLAAAGRLFRIAAVISVPGLLLGLTSLAAGDLARAGGLPVSELGFRAGFFLWLLALAALAVCCCWRSFVVREAGPRRP
jgi:hypothetical protein